MHGAFTIKWFIFRLLDEQKYIHKTTPYNLLRYIDLFDILTITTSKWAQNASKCLHNTSGDESRILFDEHEYKFQAESFSRNFNDSKDLIMKINRIHEPFDTTCVCFHLATRRVHKSYNFNRKFLPNVTLINIRMIKMKDHPNTPQNGQ